MSGSTPTTAEVLPFTTWRPAGPGFSLVLVVHPLDLARLHRQTRSGISQELSGYFVHTDQGTLRIVGSSVDVEDIVHSPDELAALLG
jgi:hypothetical protein